MAIDNLNYMVSWLPAWQQTDKYSWNPWCVKSKNLDIFSSSKSVKATAWDTQEQWATSYIDIDERGNLRMMSDGKVYDKEWNLVVDPVVNFVSYKVDYKDWNWFVDWQFWTPKRMFVKYVWDSYESIVIFTDRVKYNWSKEKITNNKGIQSYSNLEYDDSSPFTEWYAFHRSNTSDWSWNVRISATWPITKAKLKVYADQYTSSAKDVTLESIILYIPEYEYSAKDWVMVQSLHEIKYTYPTVDIINKRQYFEFPTWYSWYTWIWLDFRFRNKSWQSWQWRWDLYVDFNTENARWQKIEWWDLNETYEYLPIKDRNFSELWEYNFEKWTNVQTLYKWDYDWVERNWDYAQWSYITKWVRNTDASMNIVTWVVRNTNPYLIWNQGWNWYIIPAPIGWDTETPYIAEWIKLLNAVPQDYYLYLVGEERWVSWLYVYSWQQLVKLLTWTEIKSEFDTVDNAEQYRFSWIMCNYKSRVVLWTEDWRVFMYWKTTNWNGWSFIHETWWDITWIKVQDDKLVVEYTRNDVKYRTIFEDAIHSKHYNTEFEAIYPITLWNHILEKEESDLYTSYILPSKDCKLEFWATANHYTYWSFKSDDEVELNWMYKMKWWTWDYELEFIEKNWKRYTFRLWGDLPVQTTNEMKITNSEGVELINYTEYNNFRRIWVIETAEYLESKTRFHNINNLLDLPRTHSIQIMVRGYGTQTHTPELFNVDLVASQRERW